MKAFVADNAGDLIGELEAELARDVSALGALFDRIGISRGGVSIFTIDKRLERYFSSQWRTSCERVLATLEHESLEAIPTGETWPPEKRRGLVAQARKAFERAIKFPRPCECCPKETLGIAVAVISYSLLLYKAVRSSNQITDVIGWAGAALMVGAAIAAGERRFLRDRLISKVVTRYVTVISDTLRDAVADFEACVNEALVDRKYGI
jgi:hypothetical protein